MTMPPIYAQHKAAFPNVSAYVIAKDGERIATIAIKYPSGSGLRLYAYVHFLGMPMVRAFAGGGGYDKVSAAIQRAGELIAPEYFTDENEPTAWAIAKSECEAFRAALVDCPDGGSWDIFLRKSGYVVWQAV